jgi:hypothetical protein
MALRSDVIVDDFSGFIGYLSGNFFGPALPGTHPGKEKQVAHPAGVRIKAYRLRGAMVVVNRGRHEKE